MMIIKNRQTLDTTELRGQAMDIVEAGIARVLPEAIMRSEVSFDPSTRVLTVAGQKYDASRGRIFIIGGGKASGLMAVEIEQIIGPDNIAAGIVSCKSDTDRQKAGLIKIIPAGHPVPDQRGVNAVREMLYLKEIYSMDENDLMVCLISGGGSALMPSPAEGITLEDKQHLTGLLLGSGADITEINTVRKHLSATKGGRMGEHYAPATVVSLILSDVIGNDLSVIASGPTFPDASTFSEAMEVLEKYGALTETPDSIKDILRRGVNGQEEETPKTLDNCHNHIIGDNTLALEAMAQKATELGFKPHIITAEQQGDTADAARMRAEEIMSGKYKKYNALIIGGETTPTLPADAGRGGRNQHYAAVSMQGLAGYSGDWVVASVGTDGSDFLPDTAGAIVDGSSLDTAGKKDLNVKLSIDGFDSNTLLAGIGDCLIETGDTGTNVGDVVLYLTGNRK